ncbi:major facilitator superfamily domain-containing protein [Kickxella alabastrina]|uniref:major facilitator superfamily domain-containing protein n=1 Tax=Kickxella alabastrina TaxID=61397 RepID=UPI002220E45B|nr:major facilitator superfamily domain-containing protein [Kickxella alabastrina]KAI7833466.1 major facilitator superfamily domain-containing protein [Kickxella alabastrina]
MLGNLIISISTHSRSFSTMVAGRILYGLGSGTITVVQETILGSWFKGKGLALTIAIQITTSRIASFLSMGTAIPIADRFGFYGAAFWANFLVCALSFAINIVYMMAMRRIRKDTPDNMLNRLRTKHRFNPRLILFFFGIYWMFIVESFTLGGGWNSFLHINSELIKLRFGVNDAVAAWSASVSQIMPIFLVPFLGWFFDTYGLRTDMLMVSSVLFTVSMVLLGFTMVTPIIGLVIFSISLALGPLAEITAISLILPSSSLGTGLGIYKSSMSIGSTIVDIVIGVLQDRGSRLIEDSKHSYSYVMAFFVLWGILSTFVASSIFFTDRFKWNSLLRCNAEERVDTYHAVKEKINRPMLYVMSPNWREYVSKWNYVPLVVLSALLVTSLALFASKLA